MLLLLPSSGKVQGSKSQPVSLRFVPSKQSVMYTTTTTTTINFFNLNIATIYGTIILPVVLYGCETWSLTLRVGRRLKVFENRVLRKIFGHKRDEVRGEWRKLHEEFNDLYCSPHIVRVIKSRRMRWAGHVARMGERRGTHRVLVGKPEGKRPLERPRRRWEDNINMDLNEVVVWTGSSWLRVGTGGGHL